MAPKEPITKEGPLLPPKNKFAEAIFEEAAMSLLPIYPPYPPSESDMTSVDGAINSLLAAKESAIKTQVAFAVEAKRLDASKLEGQAAVELLEAAAQISKSLSTGKQFDAVG